MDAVLAASLLCPTLISSPSAMWPCAPRSPFAPADAAGGPACAVPAEGSEAAPAADAAAPASASATAGTSSTRSLAPTATAPAEQPTTRQDFDTVTRTPPHDEAAEQAVIGAALLAPALIADLAGIVQPDDFGRPAHGVLWESSACTRAGSPRRHDHRRRPPGRRGISARSAECPTCTP